MFLRYAHNIRHGFGFSWNLDGVHTYGPTSLLWSFCALLLSYLPTDPWTQLLLGSWFFSIAAVLAMAWAVTGTPTPKATGYAAPCASSPSSPFHSSPPHSFKATSSTAWKPCSPPPSAALFVGFALLWRAGTHPHRTSFVRRSPCFFFLARPESALITVLFPLLRLPYSRAALAPTLQVAAYCSTAASLPASSSS